MTGANRDEKCSRILRVLPDYSPSSHGLQGLPIVSVSLWLVIQRRWEKDNCRSEDKDNSKDKKNTNLKSNSPNRLQSLPSLSVVTKTKKNLTTRITNQKTNISSHWLQDYEFTRKDEDDWKNNGNTNTKIIRPRQKSKCSLTVLPFWVPTDISLSLQASHGPSSKDNSEGIASCSSLLRQIFLRPCKTCQLKGQFKWTQGGY